MSSPHSTEAGISKGDWALFCLAGVLGFVVFVVERTPLNVGGALIAMCALLVHPVINLPWMRHTTTAKQRHIRQGAALLIAFSAVGGLGYVNWPKPLVVAQPTVTITQGTTWITHSFDDTFFWLRFNPGDAITPVNVMVELTLTNVKPTPIVLSNLSLEILGAHGTWWPLTNLPTRLPIWQADRIKNPTGISLTTLPEGFILDKIGNVELPSQRVIRGWLLCQVPPEFTPLRDFMSRQLRLRVRDTAGGEVVKVLDMTASDPKGNLLYTVMSVRPVYNEDLSKYKIIPYGAD